MGDRAGRDKAADGVGLSGDVWLSRAEKRYLGSDRIALLEKIDEHGSITGAAKAAGISYKTAWDAVNALNNLSEKPLVRRTTGGAGGGGAALTEEGREIVGRFRTVQREHRKFLGRLREAMGDGDPCYPVLRRIALRVSARNVLLGRVAGVRRGPVSTEVTLALKGDDRLVAVVTGEGFERLGLSRGNEVYAIIKASSVILGRELHGAGQSGCNVLCGTVAGMKAGPVNAEVTVALAGGSTLAAVITSRSLKELALRIGDHACALVQGSSVILGVDA